MAQWFQKAAVALLLASPSTLHKAYCHGQPEEFEAELQRLGFSPEGIQAARDAQTALREQAGFLHATSEALRKGVWAGSEPHPNDDDARKIVQALKALDVGA
jgi:hypothetical protein